MWNWFAQGTMQSSHMGTAPHKSSLNKSLMEVSQHCGWNLPLLQITGSLLCVAVSISAFFELICFSGRSRSLTSVTLHTNLLTKGKNKIPKRFSNFSLT